LAANVCAELYSIAVVNFYDADDTGLTGITNWIVSNASTLASAAGAVVKAV
jgi:hypothetical protein